MSILWLDYESKSRCDLKAHGASNYCRDASTKMICAAYAFDDEDVQLWWAHEPPPPRLVEYFAGDGQIRCHNSEFDMQLTWYVVCPDYDLPEPKLERWYCTAAQARSNCAPGSLEDVGRFASASMRKDRRGSQLIRLCCIPPFSEDPAVLAELGEYAKQDVRAMRAISKGLRPLSEQELADFHVNCRINLRGVLVDVELCEAAMRYAADELEGIQKIVVEVTEGAITSVRSPKMRQWVQDRVGPEALRLMTVHKDGEKKYSIDKTVRANLLALAEENPDEIPPSVADVIQCADDLWASSVAKFSRLQKLADFEDGRVRGAFVFAGGSATGRASSYGAQVHNFTRKCAKQPDDVRRSMVRGHAIVPAYGARVTDVLKGMLRPALVPATGRVFAVADWSAIEGRVNPWLSNCPSGEQKLQAFRDKLDPYKVNAAALYGVGYADVTDAQRQVGKVQELALGFLGGAGSFDTFGRVYGVRMTEGEIARAISVWRRHNPWAMQHGTALEEAYRCAMRNRGHEIKACRVTYLFDGLHLWYALPSGRILCYPYARFDDEGEVTYAKASWKPAADAEFWPRARLWRGLAVENCTQAMAHDLLRAALRRLEAEGFEAVLHVHDEVVLECDADKAEFTMQRLQAIMAEPPVWCADLPLTSEAKIMTRYGK